MGGIISGQVPQPDPIKEASQPVEKPRETKSQKDEKSGGVNFYELDDGEESLPTGNDPIPQVTMPSFKKRVHSQRIPQHERPAVTPYEGPYDEKYSSDEENIEYDVCEPDDLTERSNSTVTFSEDVYDSDAIDEMIKSQMRKPSQEGSLKSEDIQSIKEGRKSPKSILKDKGGNKKRGSLTPNELGVKLPGSVTVSPSEIAKTLEESMTAGAEKISEAVISGTDKKKEKGEKIIEDMTQQDVTNKVISVQGEKETVTKSFQSTIPRQIDQITDFAATNKHDLADKSVTKPLQEIETEKTTTTSLKLDNTTKSKDEILEGFQVDKPHGILETKISPVTEKFESKMTKAQDSLEKTKRLLLESDEKIPFSITNVEQVEKIDSKVKDLVHEDKPVKEIVPELPKSEKVLVDSIKFTKEPPKEYTTKESLASKEQIPEIIDSTATAQKPFTDKTELQKSISTSKEIKDDTKEKEVETPVESKTKPEPIIAKEKIIITEEDAKIKAQELIEDITKKINEVIPKELSDVRIKKEKKSEVQESFPEKSVSTPENGKSLEKVPKTLDGRDKKEKTSSNINTNESKPKDGKIGNGVMKTFTDDKKKEEEKIKSDISFEKVQSSQETIDQKPKTETQVTQSVSNGVAKLIGKEKTEDSKSKEEVKLFSSTPLEQIQSEIKSKDEKPIETQVVHSVSNGVAKGIKKDGDEILLKRQGSPSKSDVMFMISDSSEEEPISTTNIDSVSPSVAGEILSSIDSGLSRTIQGTFGSIMGETPEIRISKEESSKYSDFDEDSPGPDIIRKGSLTSPDSDSKPRVIFRIESEDDLLSDYDNEVFTPSEVLSSSEEFAEKIRKDLKAKLERDQKKLEERLNSFKAGIFDISKESISKTKELVDERLRKISEIKPPKELEDLPKKEKSPVKSDTIEEIKIGRFHITPALVEEVVQKNKENEIAERIKTTRGKDEEKEEIEKELPEKLTEADLEEVIRELKLEGLSTDVYLQPENKEKEEKKERTLKRVERRFERMASETLEKEKEEADSVSEEKLDEKREVEFQRMVSQLSNEEVAEYQQEYLQLWEEGGLSSLTPTDDWESRDPDTPENELEEDSPRKPESFRGSHGIGKNGEPIKSSDSKKPLKSPSQTKLTLSEDISPSAQSLTPVDPSTHIAFSPSEVDQSSGFISERSEDIPTYGERKKFWEQMSSSQSSETANELPRSMPGSISSRESLDIDKKDKDFEEQQTVSVKAVKQKFEKDDYESVGVVKSLTESYSKKIEAGEFIMPAVPRPKSTISKDSSDDIPSQVGQLPDFLDTAVVSELEVKLKSTTPSAPITEDTVIPGTTEQTEIHRTEHTTTTQVTKTPLKERVKSTDSEAEFLAKYGVESVAFDNTTFSEEDDISLPLTKQKDVFKESFEKRPPPVLPSKKSFHERSMSLPAEDIPDDVKLEKRYFEEEMKKEIIVEQIMTQEENENLEVKTEREDKVEPKEPIFSKVMDFVEKEGEIMEEKLLSNVKEKIKPAAVLQSVSKIADKIPKTLNLKESLVEKSETEDSEKVKESEFKSKKKEDDQIPSITVTAVPKKQSETASIGESEDTQSESDVTPEDARVVDNGDTHWDGIHSGGFSPKDDIDYPREIGETGIGRWIGQEDLSKQIWEKDDLDSSHFKIQTKWERTRSEGASPKDHYVYTPEEHYPDTVWEVPVQEQLEKEEVTHDIPIEKQVIVEKDEEEEEEEEPKKVQLTEEEAKEIAEEVLEYIQFEVENRSSFLINDDEEDVQDIASSQVTDYIRHLADEKDLDERDVQLIESVIKKQRDLLRKSQLLETTASSMDITDEELRSTGADNDISPLESQITKLQNLDEMDYDKMSSEISEKLEKVEPKEFDEDQTLKDARIVDQTIAEVKESLEAAQEQLIEQHKKRKKTDILKKESPSEFEFKALQYERSLPESIEEHSSDLDSRPEKQITESVEQFIKEQKEVVLDKEVLKDPKKVIEKTKDFLSFETQTKNVIKIDKFDSFSKEKEKEEKTEPKKTETLDKTTSEKQTLKEKDKTEGDKGLKLVEGVKILGKGLVQEGLVLGSKIVEDTKPEIKTQKAIVQEIKQEEEYLQSLDSIESQTTKLRKMESNRFSSEESTKSTSLDDSIRSPPAEEIQSSTSEKQFESKSEKPEVILRHPSGTTLKADRRSDLEPYSSSGESHYHSFEQTSSRPCSSDVEGLLAGNVGTAGSSEYESAVSQDTSSKQATSTDYHTAVSSLSSRESIKSLDSESSGHLASVEVSSEASETLIPSALELDKDLEGPPGSLLEYDGPEIPKVKSAHHRTRKQPSKPTLEDDFEIVSESEVASLAGEASEDDEGVLVTGEEVIPDDENAQKMKRSHEMTFQPEPKPVVFSDSLDGLLKDENAEKTQFGVSLDETSSIVSVPDEKFGSSLEESGSVLSMSLSTTSEPSAMRTVIELSHTDSEKMDGSLTASVASIDSTTRDDLEPVTTQPTTNEMSTSTIIPSMGKKSSSVTITTSSSDDQGVPSVSTQVTSVSRKSSMADETKSESDGSTASSQITNISHANGPTQVDYVPDYDEVENTKTKKPQGHRRTNSNFVPSMMWNLSEAKTQRINADIMEIQEEYESDKYVFDSILTEKEVKNDEKKEADDLETSENYALERKISEGEEVEEFKEYERPLSQTSKTDSESGRRPVSSIFSEDRPDSEISELMKQGSSETEKEDPLERPLSPEPEEIENKDITPEFSSEAQASVTELEMEYSGACSRRDEYASHVSPIREEKFEAQFKDHEKDQGEDEKMSGGLHSQTSLESNIAEKHELESGEKEIIRRKSSDIPDITVTEHMTPVLNQKFQYPEAKDEGKEKKTVAKTPDTPASTSSRTSSSSTEGREYNLDEAEVKKFSREVLNEEKEVNETKDDKESVDSPSSDSFEMLDKPDITDEFVIIEEVGREAQENDQEGKSIKITSQKKKVRKPKEVEDEIILSPPKPETKMTDLKYFPNEEDSELFSFDSDSPPQPTTRRFVEKLKRKSSKEEKDESEYDQQIEQSKKWVEMQFQGEQAAKIIGGYGYEMEFERAPLEDIKEEDLNELESSSKIGSMGSQKESLGSFGSVKDSFSSTPDYDVLAGKKYFTRSGDHDDVSMSSLQEFELIEKKLMENGKKSGSSSSQDSLSSKKLGTSSKSGQGDDISTASLREFENLESACATVVKMETKAKQEEAILSEIDEGHESQISESESCETVSAVMREKVESDTEDFDKRMFEIDEIIRQAQSNVEKFSEMQALEKIESMGRGDSYEEVAKVPDLELDMPLPYKQDKSVSRTSYSTQVVTKKKVQQWRAAEGMDKPQIDPKSSDFASKNVFEGAKHSDLLENGGKIKSISADSLEIQTKEKQIMLEGKDDTISLDSYKRKTQKSDYIFQDMTHKSDSMEEVSKHHESSSGDYSSSGTDHTHRAPPRADFQLGSTDSLDPSSSTATHATYQYETDSVMSSSFTSGGSNTMVSSTDNLDMLVSGQSVINLNKDFSDSKSDDLLENLEVGETDPLTFTKEGRKGETRIYREKLDLGGKTPFESETVEPLQDEEYTHIIHKKTQMVPEAEKIIFKGPDAEKKMQEYIEKMAKSEVEEIEEVDNDGNIHIKRIIREVVVERPDMDKSKDRDGKENPSDKEKSGKSTDSKLESYLRAQKIKEKGIEIEHIDEEGKVLVKHVLGRKSKEEQGRLLSQEELQQYLDSLEKSEFEETNETGVVTTSEVQKIIFKGQDAEKQMKEYIESQKPEIEEVEEIDEHGNVHIKRIVKQRIFVRPQDVQKTESKETLEQYLKEQKAKEDLRAQEHGKIYVEKVVTGQSSDKQGRVLSKEELQQYLGQMEEPEYLETDGQSSLVKTGVHKITFKGPDAEKQLKEFMESQEPEVEEIEEVDEDGNVHVKRIVRQRVFVRPQDLQEEQLELDVGSKVALEQYLKERAKTQQKGEGSDEGNKIYLAKVSTEEGSRRMLTQELQEYLKQTEEPEYLETDGQTGLVKTGVHKITFKGPDAEKQLNEFMESQEPEVEEVEEVDEHGNVHIKRIVKQRVFVRPQDLQRSEVVTSGRKEDDLQSRLFTEEEFQRHLEQIEKPEYLETDGQTGMVKTGVHKIAFKGPDAEKQLKEFMESQEPEVEEIEEVDEYGNVHIKRIVRQRVFVKPQDLQRSESQTSGSSSSATPLEQLLRAKKLQKEGIEIEEKDLEGKIYIRKVLGKKADHAESRMLTQEELQQYLEELEEPEYLETDRQTGLVKTGVHKITFKGPDAEKQLKEFMESQEPEVEEVEEVDEHGNVHIKRIVKQRVFVKPQDLQRSEVVTSGRKEDDIQSRLLTEEEFQRYLEQIEKPEYLETDGQTGMIKTGVHKIAFKGPDAEKQLKEFMESQEPEVEEIEEVDEHGNVHIKRVVRQRVFVRPDELAGGTSKVQKVSFKGSDANKELEEYLSTLGPDAEVVEVEQKDEHGNIHIKKVLRQKVIIRPEELEDRQLTKEELQDYLKERSRKTTMRRENIDIGGSEPFVSEIIEPLDDRDYSHMIHRTVEMAPEVQKVTFRGPDAEKALEAYISALDPGEDFEETEEVDEDGNIHVKRILRRKMVLKPEDLEKTGLTGENLKSYLKDFEHKTFSTDSVPSSFSQTSSDPTLTEAFSSSVKLTEKDEEPPRGSESGSAVKKESGNFQRPPLLSDISMDDEAEYDTTEHDWRHQLEILHAEADEEEIGENLDAALSTSTSQKKV